MADAQFNRMLDRSIALMRGDSTTLAVQSFRLSFVGTQNERETVGGKRVKVGAMLYSKDTADVQPGDRFFVDGRLFEVIYVRPSIVGIYMTAECESL